jgi:hypothetical protein
MKIRTLIIGSVILILSAIISCVNWRNFDSTIVSISIQNGEAIYKRIHHLEFDKSIVKLSEYFLMLDLKISDSLTSSGSRRINYIINPMSYIYGAYDPARENNYHFKDSIKDVKISSLYKFNDTLEIGESLNSLFEVYCNYLNWYSRNDTINISKSFPNKNIRAFINHSIQEPNTRWPNDDTNPDFVLRLLQRPHNLKQRFVLTLTFNSGIILSDTTLPVKFIN